MSVFYEESFTVDSRDTDPFGQCRPSALLGYLQEAATTAAVRLHVDRDRVIAKYHVFWMLARIWYQLDRPIDWDETVTVKTWHRGGKGATMYRDFDISIGGEKIGQAVSVWVLADIDTHKLARLSKMEEFQGSDGGELCKDILVSKLRLPEEMSLEESRRLHYSDADVNGHVNNVRYADLLCDTLHMEQRPPDSFVSAVQIGYLAECRPGDILELYMGRAEKRQYVRGVGSEGTARFDGMAVLSETKA